MNVIEVLIVMIVLGLIGAFVGGLMIQYEIEFWIELITDRHVDIAYWKCCIGGIFIGWNLAVPVLLVTWIVDAATEQPTEMLASNGN